MQYNKHAVCIVRHVMRALESRDKQIDFLCGAYIVGPASWYMEWCGWFGFTATFFACSHKSDKPVYRITTNQIPEIVFGFRDNQTWIQLEKHDPAKYPIAHLWDFIVYSITHKNQGPLGESVHTDTNPIVANEKAST